MHATQVTPPSQQKRAKINLETRMVTINDLNFEAVLDYSVLQR